MLKPYYETKLGKLYHGDWLNNPLPDKCANLIICDPPYYKIKGDFDFKWKTFSDYLADVQLWANECKRVLADNGTLFWWGYSKKIAYTQIILDKLFRLENVMIWKKTNSYQYHYYNVTLSRRFLNYNERLLMYSNDFEPSYFEEFNIEKTRKEFLYSKNPFSTYMREEFTRAGVSKKEIALLFPSKTGNVTGCVRNWLNGNNVITEAQYLKIREYLNGQYFLREYEDLIREYEVIHEEYENQRRYFNNKLKIEEVLTYSQDAKTSKNYNHETIKPIALTKDLILTCSKPGDTVVVPFVGSGTECCASDFLNRKYYGFEIDQKYCEVAAQRLEQETSQLKLFNC